jgi:ABC-type polysaccharide/polyol phosphate transport system ATPase subunit
MTAVEVRDLHKRYRRYGRRRTFGTFKSALLSGHPLRDLQPDDVFDALTGVSFDVARGRTCGIIGRNGSGKSTLLKLIAGIGVPTSGHIRVEGRVSALIELGAGFHPEISGRENVLINGMMLGLSKREVEGKFDEIVSFAELAPFIDAPVKTYSSGMYMRLGFAVAIHVDPDVLLVDEVLAVGDESFTHKCLAKFGELRRRGKTVLLVTHTTDLVTRFCDEAIWIDAGVVRATGDPKRVVDAYLMDVAAEEGRTLAARDAGRPVSRDTPPLRTQAEPGPPADMFRAEPGRWGTQEAEIVAVEMRCGQNAPAQVLTSGEPFELRLRVRAAHPLSDVAFGFAIFNAEGVCCYGTNTHIDGATASPLVGEAEVSVRIDNLYLVDGLYSVDVAVHNQSGLPYDYHRQLHSFRVQADTKDVGIFRPPHRWTASGGLTLSGQHVSGQNISGQDVPAKAVSGEAASGENVVGGANG